MRLIVHTVQAEKLQMWGVAWFFWRGVYIEKTHRETAGVNGFKKISFLNSLSMHSFSSAHVLLVFNNKPGPPGNVILRIMIIIIVYPYHRAHLKVF